MSQIRVKLTKRKIKNVKARRDVKRKRARVGFMVERNGEYEEFGRYLDRRKTEEWIVSAKKTLDWFLSHMGEDEWVRRRNSVVKYFRKQQDRAISVDPRFVIKVEDEDSRVAFHEDWIAWYLYLVESVYYRPYVDEPSQSARVYPFFSAIGRYVKIAKSIKGIEGKLDELLKGNNNQPDSLLFEIVVAIMYKRNGWLVEFVPENPLSQTPDLLVTRNDEKLYVECKRQKKSTEYLELERKEWRIRWEKLVPVMAEIKVPIFLDVKFKVELSQSSSEVMVDSFLSIIHRGHIEDGASFENDEVVVEAKLINMSRVYEHFSRYQVRWNSPQMIALFAGSYDGFGSYSQVHLPTGINAVGPDDDEHILNLFCDGVSEAYCAKWECLAEESISKKAKDVKKLLSKAVNQSPKDFPTVIHIGYETLHGPEVEFLREKKIRTSINNFDFKDKDIRAVYCHAVQSFHEIDKFECAETTMRFGKQGVLPEDILSHDLLLDEPGMNIKSDTHWNEDFSEI
ncbi:hypothetical protein [Pseudoteredinibacter isoporae]|uniref:hypothetical protein n=1 Tax=Pseudoteredinibacter isoporae TaxID=570281 RepID=UPI003102DFE1